MKKIKQIFNKKISVKEDDLFILSSDKHKMNALFYDKIFPMHSMKKVPSKYQVDISLPFIKDIPEFNDFMKKAERFFDGVQKSSRDSIRLNHCMLLGGNGLLDKGGSYEKLFNNIDSDSGYNKLTPIEWPIAWLRDAATLLLFEILTIYEYKKVVPIFTSTNLYSNFIEHGGLIVKPVKEELQKPIIEVVQNNCFELLEDKTEWEQVKETRKDIESLKAIQRINRILTSSYKEKEKNAFYDKIDETIFDFENATKKHGLLFKTAKQYLYLDIATASSLSFFSTLSFIYGAPLPVTLSALAGATFQTTKAIINFNEKKTSIKLPNNEIVNYIESAKREIESKFELSPDNNEKI